MTKHYVDDEWVELEELEDSWRKWKELSTLQMENHQLPVDDPIITVGRVLEYYKEMHQAMLRFRKAAEDLGEYAADLDDKLEAVEKCFLERAKECQIGHSDPEIHDVICEFGQTLTDVEDYNLEKMIAILRIKHKLGGGMNGRNT